MVASIIVVIVIPSGGRGVGMVFSENFFLTGELGHLGHEGHCSLWYCVLDLTDLVLLVAYNPHTRPNSSIAASLARNIPVKHLSSCCLLAFYCCTMNSKFSGLKQQ